MGKVAKLEFLLMDFIQSLVRLTEIAKSLVTFLISFLPQFFVFTVWLYRQLQRSQGRNDVWLSIQGGVLLTLVVQSTVSRGPSRLCALT